MAEAKWIYLFDRNNGNRLMYADVLHDGEAMPDNATTVVCPNGLYDPYFDEAAQTWKGITKEEWEARLPKQTVKPSESQQLLMAQQAKITQLQKSFMSQETNMTQMQKLIMAQQATITELKKGSN